MKHLVIGGNGAIGQALIAHLHHKNEEVTIASRNPKKIAPTDQILPLDLLDTTGLEEKLRGYNVLYLIVGLPYRSRVWLEGFPKVVGNVVQALQGTTTRLVYFDNVYMYGPVQGWRTENTTLNPGSVKGTARQLATQLLMEAVEKGKIETQMSMFPTPIKRRHSGAPPLFTASERGISTGWCILSLLKVATQ